LPRVESKRFAKGFNSDFSDSRQNHLSPATMILVIPQISIQKLNLIYRPETIYVVPIKRDSEHYPPEGKLRVYRSRKGGNEWEALTKGLPQKDCYVDILRDAMAVDTLDECGVYFGTTGGQVYASADSGDSWEPIVRDLPAVLSVEVQTIP